MARVKVRSAPLVWPVLSAVVLGWLIGCGGARTPLRAADAIERSEVLPVGYDALGTARASCEPAPIWSRLDEEPLTRFDCHAERLGQALAEQAALAGGTLLAGQRCRARAGGGFSCSATIGRPESAVPAQSGPRATSARPQELSPHAARHIRVDVLPARAHARRAVAADSVLERPLLPVSHVPLGWMRTRCDAEDCASDDLRVALRIAAAGLGVSDLIGVSCATLADGRECVATLAVTEHDPEREPRAR